MSCPVALQNEFLISSSKSVNQGGKECDPSLSPHSISLPDEKTDISEQRR
jgi:hypothetical protein